MDVEALKSASATHATKTAMEAADKALADALAEEVTRAQTEESSILRTAEDALLAAGNLATELETTNNTITGHASRIRELEDASANHATHADLQAANDAIDAIEANYVKVSGTNLVTQSGDVIIFDCGGAQ